VPNKTLSRVVLPDAVLNFSRPGWPIAWGVAVAGWAVSVCLLIASSLIVDLSSGVKGGIDGAFTNVPAIFVGGMVTVVVVTFILRLRAARSDKLTVMLFSLALGLFALIGAVAVVLGVIGLFVALTDSGLDNILLSLFQHLGGLVLGAVLILWSFGEWAVLSRVTPAALTGVAIVDGKVAGLQDFSQVIPPSITGRKELKSTWEIAVAGFMVAALLFAVGAITEGIVTDVAVALPMLLLGGPVAVAVVTYVARLRNPDSGPLGRACIDLAVLLALALGLIVFAVICFLKALSYNGFGNVVGGLVWGVSAGVMGALIVVWSMVELAVLRGLAGGPTITMAGVIVEVAAAPPVASSGPPPAAPYVPPYAPPYAPAADPAAPYPAGGAAYVPPVAPGPAPTPGPATGALYPPSSVPVAPAPYTPSPAQVPVPPQTVVAPVTPTPPPPPPPPPPPGA